MSVVCRDDDNPDVYLEVRMGTDQEPVITQLEKNGNQALKQKEESGHDGKRNE